jgi:hypothetical protein
MNISTRLGRLALPVLAGVGLATAASVGTAEATPPDDWVVLTGSNIDFGGEGGLLPVLNSPASPGILEWDTTGGTVTPHLTGKLYLDDALGLDTRIQLRYFDVFDNVLATRAGVETVGQVVYATSNDVESWTVDLAPYANPDIYRVQVRTQYRLGNTWYVDDRQDVYI